MAKTFDPIKLTVTVGGRIITGFSDGSIISVELNDDTTIPYKGSQGDISYSLNACRDATATLSLATTSDSITFLNGLASSRSEFPLSVSDASDGSSAAFTCDQCRILKPAAFQRNKEIDTVEVNIFIPRWDF